jgi:hypothetical protein
MEHPLRIVASGCVCRERQGLKPFLSCWAFLHKSADFSTWVRVLPEAKPFSVQEDSHI